MPLANGLAPNTKTRGYIATCNNWSEEDLTYARVLASEALYAIIGKEIGEETGTPHLQMYFYFKNARCAGGILAKMPRAWINIARGSHEENKAYCSEDGDYEEFGTMPVQGRRKDLTGLTRAILDGDMTVDQVLIENPQTYHTYGRTLRDAEVLRNRRRYRNWKTRGFWYFGETGTGKSHYAMEDFKPETHYRWNLMEDKQDYCGQPIVIIDEFRGQLPLSILLQLVDEYPMNVAVKFRNQFPFLAEMVIVTSSLPPEKIYHNLTRGDSLAQVYRRFEVYEFRFKSALPSQPGTGELREVIKRRHVYDRKMDEERTLEDFLGG